LACSKLVQRVSASFQTSFSPDHPGFRPVHLDSGPFQFGSNRFRLFSVQFKPVQAIFTLVQAFSSAGQPGSWQFHSVLDHLRTGSVGIRPKQPMFNLVLTSSLSFSPIHSGQNWFHVFQVHSLCIPVMGFGPDGSIQPVHGFRARSAHATGPPHSFRLCRTSQPTQSQSWLSQPKF